MLRKLLIVLVLFGSLVAAPSVQAQIAGGQMFQKFVAALNQGDVTTALTYASPTFTLTLAGGQSATGAATAPLLASLPTPITIISLSVASRAGHSTLQFGSGAPVSVDFTGSNGRIASMTVNGSVGSAAPAAGSGAPVAAFAAGWNLIAAPPGTDLAGADGPLYTLQPGESTYETAVAGATTAGFGYWAFFSGPTSAALGAGAGTAYSVRAPAGQYIMIGDPSGTVPAQVSGADAVYVYDAAAGYQQTARLNPGQGAFAISLRGGTITVTP